jgi:mono/diheme cytochrome c family protein
MMESIYDVLLPITIPPTLARGLLFATFTFHMLFLLTMLGTGILALAYFIRAWWGRSLPGRDQALSELRWDKRVLWMFLALETLAVVLGVGPLLLIQVTFPVPFFTAVSLFAPAWMLIIVLLIVAFLCFDSLGHKIYVHRYLHLGFGIVAMMTLLVVPGFFVAVLVTAENSDKWMDVIRGGFRLDWRLTAHWAFRYLHVLGAAVVFGAAFHYFFLAGDNVARKRSLMHWMVGGLIWQVALGILLFASLFQEPDLAIYLYLATGVTLTGIFIGLAAFHRHGTTSLGGSRAMPALIVLLVAMLMTRQGFQDRAFASLMPEVRQAAAAYHEKLAPYRDEVIARYKDHIRTVYDNGPTIYANSCAFCHGASGQGDGPDAKHLNIPPERLAEIRSTRAYLFERITHGVPGTAMPYFNFFSPPRREDVIDYLDQKWGVLKPPSALPVTVSEADMRAAAREWRDTCSQCHGMDGKNETAVSRHLSPSPPDLSVYSPQPHWAFDVITNGYPGTAMASFASLSEGERWALVQTVYDKRNPAAPSSQPATREAGD